MALVKFKDVAVGQKFRAQGVDILWTKVESTLKDIQFGIGTYDTISDDGCQVSANPNDLVEPVSDKEDV